MLEKLKLLYVEDEKELIVLMKELLEDEVASLYTASNGEEGLEMIEQYEPDIIMSDIYMPKLDGLSMSERIKERYPEKPIILLTAFTDANDLKRAIEIGIDRYINKPVSTYTQISKPLNAMAKKIHDERELAALGQQIASQSKYAAIGEVIGHITHQWKQPLSVINAKLLSLQLKQELSTLEDAAIEVCISETLTQVSHLTQTISDFKDFLKPKEEPKSFFCSSVFHKIDSLIGTLIQNEKITLRYVYEDFNISGYENKLVHVLLNLINNAHDAIVERAPAIRLIEICARPLDNRCVFEILDSGGGIEKDLLQDIFNPYFTTKSEDKGTGLGLYMAREFISGHMNGTLSVENVSRKFDEGDITGARFEIIIPLTMEQL